MNELERGFLAALAAPPTASTGMGSLKDVLNLGNPFSKDYFWWQIGRAATGKADESPSLIQGALAPSWFVWGSVAAAAAGGLYLYKRKSSKKGRR